MLSTQVNDIDHCLLERGIYVGPIPPTSVGKQDWSVDCLYVYNLLAEPSTTADTGISEVDEWLEKAFRSSTREDIAAFEWWCQVDACESRILELDRLHHMTVTDLIEKNKALHGLRQEHKELLSHADWINRPPTTKERNDHWLTTYEAEKNINTRLSQAEFCRRIEAKGGGSFGVIKKGMQEAQKRRRANGVGSKTATKAHANRGGHDNTLDDCARQMVKGDRY
jgi:hypothetical protein